MRSNSRDLSFYTAVVVNAFVACFIAAYQQAGFLLDPVKQIKFWFYITVLQLIATAFCRDSGNVIFIFLELLGTFAAMIFLFIALFSLL